MRIALKHIFVGVSYPAMPLLQTKTNDRAVLDKSRFDSFQRRRSLFLPKAKAASLCIRFLQRLQVNHLR